MIQRCSVPIMFNRCKTKTNNFWINLNSYAQVAKNVHSRNNTKKMYAELIKPNISHLKPILGQFKVTYTIYRNYVKSPILFDIDNVGAILSKYFMDTIVNNMSIATNIPIELLTRSYDESKRERVIDKIMEDFDK